MNNRLINTKVAAAGGCTDIVDNYDPFGGNGVALYQLNGNANDSSPNDYDATWVGTPSYTTGVFGQSAVFNGSTSRIDTPLTSLPDSYTISMWINASAFPSGAFAQISGFKEPNSYAAWLGIYPNGSVDFIPSDGGGAVSSAAGAVSLNSWYHLVGVKDGTTGYFYLNGQSQGSTSTTATTVGSQNWNLGRYDIETTLSFTGSIDQVRIFNTALTPLEVEALYTEELCICDGTVDTLQVLGDTSCIATYQLDGNANDLSGNYSGEATDVSYGVGEFDLAGYFSGTSSRIEVPFASKPSLSTCTVSFWLKTTSTNTQALVGEGYSNGWWGNFQSYISSNKLNVRTGNASSAEDLFWASTSDVNTGSWVHCLVTMEGNTSKIYINGNLETTKALTVTRAATSEPFTIGQFYANGTLFSSWTNDCSIDQVRIFNKALDQDDVDILFAETACTKVCTGTTHTLNILGGGDTSCIAAYPLDGSPADLSGNYNGVQTDVTYPVGEFDLAGSFNGSSSKIEIGSVISSVSDTTDFSFSQWLNFSALPTSGGLMGIWGSSNANLAAIRIIIKEISGQYELSFLRNFNNTYYYSNSYPTVSLNNNSWYNLVFTYVASTKTVKYFLNGSQVSEFNLDQNAALTTDANLTLGAYNTDHPARTFNGKIDQVRIFDKALSLEEVGILFNDETPCS